MKMIVFNNTAELINELLELEKANGAFTLESITTPKVNVKSRETKDSYNVIFPKGKVSIAKREYVNWGINYEKAVNAKLERDGKDADFKAKELPWGEWVTNSKHLITHHAKFYLRYYLKLNANYKVSEKIYHYSDGTRLTDAEKERLQKEFYPVSRPSIVDCRNVNLENVNRMVASKTVFVRNGFLSQTEASDLEGWHRRLEELMERKADAVA